MQKNRPEIVSPAGNPEKLKLSIAYGADAVYFGGQEFNLRDKAGNFSIPEIAEALTFCKNSNVKSIFLLNSFLRENDIKKARQYLQKIKNFDFYAVIISDPGMLQLVKDAGLNCRIHLSTQMSTLNHLAVKFWNSQGIDRIVLGRETTIDDIKKIKEYSAVEIEIFAHGALCISYSGRCLLSRYLSGRDANQGACSHPCRWNFALIEEKRPGHHLEFIEHARGTEILSSKDLCLLKKIPLYIKAGVDAFKLEGRMKSLYYAANLTRIYKDALNRALAGKNFKSKVPFWEEELDLISHRPYTDDLFNEFGNMGFQKIPYIKKVMFMGLYLKKGETENEAYIKAFNPIRREDQLEAIFPIENGEKRDCKLIVKQIYNKNDKEDNMARPREISKIIFDRPIYKNAILRKKLSN